VAEGSGVSAVVVNYNAASVIGECIRSLWEAGVDEVVVADNASDDDSRQVVGDTAVWLPTGGNLGFGTGANRGVAATSGRYLLICNPDLVVQPGAVKTLADVLDGDGGVGIVGPRIINLDGTTYPSPRVFPRMTDSIGHAVVGLFKPDNPWTRRYKLLDMDRSRLVPAVDWVSGSCFLIRRTLWEQLGGFDESFFMFAEDMDLCWRAGRQGWRIAFEPAAGIVHAEGVSRRSHPYRMLVLHHRSLFKFQARTTRGWRRALLPLVALGLALRTVAALGQRILRDRITR
jgi:N-acetylglucosaminyl-diphospho-decaprenol L-rhamnosyltransferase